MFIRLSIPSFGLRAIATLFVLMVAAAATAQTDQRFAEARNIMVRDEVVKAGIDNERVAESIRRVPRHLFVSPRQRNLAYLDMALPIGAGQTISPPFVVASMTQALDPQPQDRVLEIGTGSGYQAAVLSGLVAEVYSIEIVESLGRKAAQTLRRQGYSNVFTKVGDGYQGWAEHAPFDKIIVTCSPERVPPALVAQLREGGRIVVPLGERYQQTMFLLKKVKGRLEAEALEPTFFVPMTGRAEELRMRKDDSGVPRLMNGSFEYTAPDGSLLGWYYVRQAEVVNAGESSEGTHWLQFTNETPGRGAQALQSMGVNGRKVRELELSLSLTTENVRPGQSSKQLPRVELSFFDERRAPLGTKVMGPWHGTSSWTQKRTRIQVPPHARLAVLAVGLFGATGQLSIDRVAVTVVNAEESSSNSRGRRR